MNIKTRIKTFLSEQLPGPFVLFLIIWGSFTLGGAASLHMFDLSEPGEKLNKCVQERAAYRTIVESWYK